MSTIIVVLTVVMVVWWALYERAARVRRRWVVDEVSSRCQIVGCDQRRAGAVRKVNTVLEVCYSCRDEMVALYGWQVTQPVHSEEAS